MPTFALVDPPTTSLTVDELKQRFEAIGRETGYDQKVAVLFNGSRLTQQQIADALDMDRRYVGRLLCFGRFIASAPSNGPMGPSLGELTERAFRGMWDNTSGEEPDRFRAVLAQMGHDVPAPAPPPTPAAAPRPTRREASRLIDTIAGELDITGGQRLSDIRTVVEHGAPNIVAMARTRAVGLQAAAAFARRTPLDEQAVASAATVRREGNRAQAVGRTAARDGAPTAARPAPTRATTRPSPTPAPAAPRQEPQLVVGLATGRILTREEIDPEFTGTDAEFVDLHGHVRTNNAQQQATAAFNALADELRALARAKFDYARQNAGSSNRIDFSNPYWLNWLREASPRAIRRMTEALDIVRPLIAEAEAALARAQAVQPPVAATEAST